MTQAKKTDSVLARLGYKIVRNFDLALAGVCLTLALTARPFTTGLYKEPLENAKARMSLVEKKADSVFVATQGYTAENDSILNMHLYNRRTESAALRDLSDDFRSARADVRRQQSMYNFASGYGYACAGTFAAMGLLSAGMRISARRRQKSGAGPAI